MTLANLSQITLTQLWDELQAEAAVEAATQPALAGLLERVVLSRRGFLEALTQRLAQALMTADVTAEALTPLLRDPLEGCAEKILWDMIAYRTRDPACASWLQPLIFFKGFAALQTQRVAHRLWQEGATFMAYYLQSRASELWQVDIHPAAQLGEGIFIDHATGVVIGETCVIGDDVTIMHGVTLGGNGKERGDRHPKIANGVLLSVGAKVLGNIKVGECARIAAGSVVLSDVPAHTTVAGIPARPVGEATPPQPADCLDHAFMI